MGIDYKKKYMKYKKKYLNLSNRKLDLIILQSTNFQHQIKIRIISNQELS